MFLSVWITAMKQKKRRIRKLSNEFGKPPIRMRRTWNGTSSETERDDEDRLCQWIYSSNVFVYHFLIKYYIYFLHFIIIYMAIFLSKLIKGMDFYQHSLKSSHCQAVLVTLLNFSKFELIYLNEFASHHSMKKVNFSFHFLISNVF